MIDDSELRPVTLRVIPTMPSSQHIQNGLPMPKIARIRVFSADEWEEFAEEWAHSLEGDAYHIVRKVSGAGDQGIDIAGFTTEARFNGPWDSLQCKRYDHALRPSDVYIEIGKIIYHTWKGEYSVPRKHYFAGSRGVGTKLEKLLGNPEELKACARKNWAEHCQKKITSTVEIPLDGALSDYFEAFDFQIFGSKSVLDLISQHERSPNHALRFGGGLPPRPTPEDPPECVAASERRYVRQILDAYGDHDSSTYSDLSALAARPRLKRDLSRQRERFYYAEALRNFSRDTVPQGTFAELQEEIFQGVIDVCDDDHESGYARMKATVARAADLSSTSNPLASATKIQDRQGICHQLANEDRLTWVLKDD